MTGHLHALACDNNPCACMVLHPVRARDLVMVPDGEYNLDNHGEVVHTLESASVPVSCSPRHRGRSRISRSNR